MKKPGIGITFYKNREYIFYYSWIILKMNVAGSYLGFFWLFLSPLMHMLIYSFIVLVVFKNNVENFSVFVLIGLVSYNLFSNTVLMGTTAIVRNKSIFQQVYFHKSVYSTVYTLSYLYNFIISLSLVFIFIIFSNIGFTWHILEMIPITIVHLMFTLGCTLIVSHIGVYVFDLRTILELLLRFFFYLSPVMWSFDTFTHPLVNILKINPIAIIINSYRNCLMFQTSPNYGFLLILAIVSNILIQFGYKLISKYEDEYARVL